MTEVASCYLYFRDESDRSGLFEVTVWLAPVDFPDDALDRLNVGYKLVLGEWMQLDDEAVQSVVGKIAPLFDFRHQVHQLILSELEAHSSNRRHKTYRVQQRAFAELAADQSLPAQAVLRAAEGIVSGSTSWESLESATKRYAESKSAEDRGGMSVEGFSGLLARHSYGWVLAKQSRGESSHAHTPQL